MARSLRHSRILATLLLASGLMSAAAQAQNIAIVNNKPIPKSRADMVINELKQRGQQDTPELQKTVREMLVEREILVQEAERRGLAKNKDVRNQMEITRQNVLIQALQRDVLSTPPSDAELQAEYNRLKGQMGEKEYHARHILVEKEESAKELIEQLKKGASFEELAKQQSKDTGSAANGGDLGWTSPDKFVPEFSGAMVKLEKGKFTETPVKSEFGWHVIKLEEARETQAPKFEEVKQQIAEGMMQQRLEKFRRELRSKASIK